MNQPVYIHEFIDINGHNRAKYMHHMTANWCPIARDERNMLCYGVWATVGSTGVWPQVVNMWELPSWDALAANFEHEFAAGRTQDPSLAQWWSVAAEFRRGGIDRIVVPEIGSRSISELVADGVRGAVYAHELVRVSPGHARSYLTALAEIGRAAMEEFGFTLVGAFRTAMRNDNEAIAIWAAPRWDSWAVFEQAWLSDTVTRWRAALLDLRADVERVLLVDAPLAPLRAGRQPQVEDRRPLDEV